MGLENNIMERSKTGDPERIRTSGLQIRNLSLCPAELRGRIPPFMPPARPAGQPEPPARFPRPDSPGQIPPANRYQLAAL
jgi:hypothetical protein